MGSPCSRDSDSDADSRVSHSSDERGFHKTGRQKAWKWQWYGNGRWRDYGDQEDKILKRAFMAGFPHAKFSLRGSQYTYDFTDMSQVNESTGKERRIRPPKGWVSPPKPVVPAGPTTCVTVPPGSAGKEIFVPHPGVKGAFVKCKVPKNAKPGRTMLVPCPPEAAVTKTGQPFSSKTQSSGIGPGGVAVGVGALGIGAGAVVIGAVLGDHVIEHGVDATVDYVGDGLTELGDGIGDTADAIVEGAPDVFDDVGDFVIDAGEFIVDTGEDVGEFIMDLF